jgi:hypothetical protein
MSILTATPAHAAAVGHRTRLMTDAVVSAYIDEIVGPARPPECGGARRTSITAGRSMSAGRRRGPRSVASLQPGSRPGAERRAFASTGRRSI